MAGGSTNPSIVPVIDIKHDPIFSHPPPWANEEKIYSSVIIKRQENPPKNNFQVKKFDFKVFEKENEIKNVEKRKYDKIEKNNKTKTINDVQTLEKIAEENPCMKNCDTIQVVADTDEEEQRNDQNKTKENLSSEIKSTSGKFYRNLSIETKQLKNKIDSILQKRKIRGTNESKTETNKKDCVVKKSLVKRFMRNSQSSKINMETRQDATSVKMNEPQNGKGFNLVRDKLSLKFKESKEDIKDDTKAAVERSTLNPRSTSLKNRLSELLKLKKDKGENSENKTLTFLKSRLSVTEQRMKTIKTEIAKSSLKSLKRKEAEDENELKTNERQKSSNFSKYKLFDRLKSKKLLNNFNIKQKWSEIKISKEFSKVVKKPKSFTSKSRKEKKTKFSDEISADFSNVYSLRSQVPIKHGPVSREGEVGNFKWNYIDGQWKKSIGL